MRDAQWFVVGLVTSGVMQAPFTSYAHFGSALAPGDGRAIAWVVAWVAHALSHGETLFDANMFYPARGALAQIEPMVSLGVIGAPVWLATHNAILVFNLLKLLGPAVSVWAAARLAFAWTGDAVAALVAGVAVGCSSFVLLHNGHIQLTWSAGLPLVVLAMERWWAHASWGRLAVWWLVAVATMLVSWYLALIVAVLAGCWLCWLVRFEPSGNLKLKALQLFSAALLGVAVLLPFAAPFLGRTSAAGEAAAFAATWQSYLVPHEHTLVGRWLVSHGYANPQGIWGERSLFLGWSAIALACIGAATALRRLNPPSLTRNSEASYGAVNPLTRLRATFLIALAVLAAALSFGPSTTGLAPFDLFERLPGASAFRASARFAILVTMAVALLAAFGLAWLRRSFPRARRLLTGLAALLLVAEVFVIDYPPGRPQPEAMPEIYRLAVDDGARAAVALPMYAGETFWFMESDYLLYSTSAGFLRLANGFGRWAPETYAAIGAASRAFPSAQTAEVLRANGITHVLLHGSRYGFRGSDVVQRATNAPDFTVVATRGLDVLLRVK